MRGVTYDYEFEKPDKTKLAFTGHTMPEVVANIKILTRTHYELDFRISKDTIYNIINRPAVAHKFFAAKVKFQRIIRPAPKTVAPQNNSIIINNGTPPTTNSVTSEHTQTQPANQSLTELTTIPTN
jgi:hypothetical protein